MKVNIGKNTLGDSDKMSVELKEYGRSTHDLSYAWRSTMGVGTLVPFMKLPVLPGDEVKINLQQKVMTHPTVGPLFGSYKLQLDIFTCPIRLYNAMLHNNALNIGLKMSTVKIPKIATKADGAEQVEEEYNKSSLLAYLNLKGRKGGTAEKYNALPILMYYDIFKNYYANKQEKKFYIVRKGTPNQGTTEDTQPISSDSTGKFNITSPITFTFENNFDFNTENDITFHVLLQGTQENVDITVEQFREAGANVVVGANSSKKVTISGSYTFSEYKNEGMTFLTATQYNEEGISLQAQDLEDIDTLREEILSKGRQEYVIGENGNCTLQWLNSLSDYCMDTMGGLVVKTHFSDLFNNWIDNEWIDGENGISAVTKVAVTDGGFTIDSLNLAEKVYNMLNRIAVSGGSYKDWIETVYTTDYYFRAETPMYEGGLSATIEFQEVVSNSASTASGSDEPLGTLAGKGFSANQKGGEIVVKVNEPSYIMGIASITPYVDYSQQNDWDMMYLDTMDDLHKPQLDGIGYQDLLEEQLLWNAKKDSAIGKTIAWINYMTNYNKTYGNFAAGGNESFMVLNRIYNKNEDGNIENASTYINPKDYTYIFAENDLSNMDFWVQIGCGVEARRVMSAKQIPLM